jgi:diguanylate cyclase (GGDEF)-like protein
MRGPMKFRATLGVQDDQPELVLAQYRAFSRQLPLMYFILLINTASLTMSFHGVAPDALSIYFPAVLGLICAGRLLLWLGSFNRTVTVDVAVRRLRMLVVLAFLLGTAFTIWGVMLFGYGGAEQKLHVVHFLIVSVFACTLCLTHLRAAAIGLLSMTTVILFLRLVDEPYGVATAMGFNGLFVAIALIVVVSRSYADFATLVQSRQVLAQRTAEAVQLFEENRELAIRDALTGLPNRRWFFAELSSAVEVALQGLHAYPIVAVIDLDGFKPVNDLYGHSAGDRILVEVAARLTRHETPHVRVARLGGDEFGIIFTDIQSRDEARWLGETICETLGKLYKMGDFAAQVNASLGISEIAAIGCMGGQLYEQADYALNYAKRSARGEVSFFTEEHAREIRDTSLIDQTLRTAVLSEELYLDYQPIVDCGTGQILAFEALGRWNSPVLGTIAPVIFIGAAERSGRINAITIELLGQMLRDMARWPSHIGLSFNLSVHDICSPDTMARISAMIAASGQHPQRIDFEITETSIMHDFDQARRTLRALKALGCGLALDDFGTGYSSLGYVHQLPLDKIKVDRSFVTDIAHDPMRVALTRSIMGLCENLGLECVVEGIEQGEQRDLIARLGAPLMQGYLFGRPQSQHSALAMLEAEAHLVRTLTESKQSAA